MFNVHSCDYHVIVQWAKIYDLHRTLNALHLCLLDIVSNSANVHFCLMCCISTNYNRVGGKRIYLNWKIANFPLILSVGDALIDMIYFPRFSVLNELYFYFRKWNGLLVEIATIRSPRKVHSKQKNEKSEYQTDNNVNESKNILVVWMNSDQSKLIGIRTIYRPN